MSPDLWNPLLRNVLEGSRTDDTEAQQEDICTGVTQRPQLVKLILERQGGDKAQGGKSVKGDMITSRRLPPLAVALLLSKLEAQRPKTNMGLLVLLNLHFSK